ncbi:hypothetical protein [Clostridium tertium]|uniref:hypothetical protein n=1 Tax=Clostridium tertium TaxID=1559 RepID=UPI001AE929AC|nr:hypothetical protein [Clostridium tertium]MBP1867567.1 hypothetical protein [Clostridium tertium]
MKTNKKKKILITVGLIILFLLKIGGIFINKIFNRVTNSPIISSSDRNEKWTKDIEFLKYQLPKEHKNLFFINQKKSLMKKWIAY